MSQFRIKQRKRKIEVFDVGGEPRISSRDLAAMLGISDEEMNRLILEHMDEASKLGPVVMMDEAGEFRVVEKGGRA